MKYCVEVREVWKAEIEVEANSPDEAREIVEEIIVNDDEIDFRYDYTLDKEDWPVFDDAGKFIDDEVIE